MSFITFHTEAGSLEDNWFLSFPELFSFTTLISFSRVYLACLYKTVPIPASIFFGLLELSEFFNIDINTQKKSVMDTM